MSFEKGPEVKVESETQRDVEFIKLQAEAAARETTYSWVV